MNFEEEPIRTAKRGLDDMSIQELKERIEALQDRHRGVRAHDREKGSDAEGGGGCILQELMAV